MIRRRYLQMVSFRSFSCSPRILYNIKLRDYQQEAINSITNAFKRNVRRPSFVLATGGGKTVVFSSLIPHIPKTSPERGNKVLVLAHTEELIRQASSTISRLNPTLKVEIDMRNLKPSSTADVIVGSVQTLVRMTRLEKYNPLEFKAIILDECHHATAGSWVKILKYFGADNPELPIYVIGCTATMERSDNQSLGTIFDEIVFERNLITMIQNKELVDVKFTSLKANLDLSNVVSTKSDYDVSSLSKAVNDSDANLVVVSAYKRLKEKYNFKSTLMFCVDIAHCKTLCGIFQREGINAQYVTGDTVKDQRFQIIEDFKNGLIDVLCNVQVFTEGTDMPNIDSLFLVRPTKSRPLLVQMIGRGLRLYKGKTVCHVADIAGTRGTGIQSVPTLFSLPLDYVIEGKSIEQLEAEKDKEIEKKKEELIEREKQRRLNEVKSFEKLQQVEKDLIISFTTIDGFMALEAKDIIEFQHSKNVHSRLSQSFLHWIRLDYDTWGVQVDERFFIIRRLYQEGKASFQLATNTFTPSFIKAAAGFKIAKVGTEKIIMTDHNLSAVITKAEVLGNDFATPRFKRLNQDKSPITQKQSDFLKRKIPTIMKRYYDVTPELQDKFFDTLNVMTKLRASLLIFAIKYSTKSLHIKWELQKILGPNKKAAKTIQKLVKSEGVDQQFLEKEVNTTPTIIFQ